MKYDSQLTELKSQLPGAQSILVALPRVLSVDRLASALSLMLALKKSGKEVTITTDGQPLVSHGNLYGVGEIKNQLNTNQGDNFVISLEGVVDASGQIPSLEKLDWYPEGQNLNLVFHAMPGQKFEPINITHKRQGGSGGFNLIFTIGATSLNDLGLLYTQNPQIFSSSYIINIDNNLQNQNFGKTNIVDTNAASLSEIVMQIFPSLNLTLDNDIASNIVAGVYDATANLTNAKPDSFLVVGQAMQMGAKLPQPVSAVPQPVTASFPSPAPMNPQFPIQEQTQAPPQAINTFLTQPPAANQIQTSPQAPPPPVFESQNQGFDLSKVLQIPQVPGSSTAPAQSESFVSPQIASQTPARSDSYEERPTGEFTASHSAESEAKPAPDWLTPKIFKGGSLG